MYTKDASTLYKEVQVKTANQGRLIVMLYEGAIKFINIAISNMPKKKYDIVNKNVTKAQDIITELMLSLNFEAKEAKNIANRLYSLYTYMNKRLLEGNVKKNVKPLREVVQHLSELKGAWDKVAATPNENENINPEANGEINIKS